MQIVLFAHVYGITVEDVELNMRLLEFEPCVDHLGATKLSTKHKTSLSITLLMEKKVKILGIAGKS